MKASIVVNPNAGKRNILKVINEIRRLFEESGASADIKVTMSREEADKAVVNAVSTSPDILVCCGGDGTLSQTVNRLILEGSSGDITLGYIPAGSTNDFAASLGMPKEPAKAAAQIIGGEPRCLDVGRFGYRYFIYVASFGAFTQSSYNTTQSLKNSLGHLAYLIEGIKELPAIKSYNVQVNTAEGHEYRGDYIFGSVSNSTSLGGIIKLDSSRVELADGKFELTLVKTPKNLLELNRIVFSLMSGKYDEELITFVHTAGAVFSCTEPMPWSLDGEYAAGGDRVEIEVMEKEIRLKY